MQLVPVRREIFSKLNVNRVGPLPIIAGKKHISPGISMSPRCHEAVPVPETASTPLVEASPQIFRRVFPREIQADRETLLMSILTTELLQKLGTYCPLRVPFRLKNASYCFSMLMDELPQGHEKFDLSKVIFEAEVFLRFEKSKEKLLSQLSVTRLRSQCVEKEMFL
ncbi:hypothetical protein TNCV_1299211 [Trichonephila clavipes]|nr:hypothetical protein TNCV_1299211 [Trichonephila clavipes]